MLVNELLHLIAVYVACLLIFVGLYSNEWKVYKLFKGSTRIKATAGLFQSCKNDKCDSNNQDEAVRVFIILGFIVSLMCAITISIYLIFNKICEACANKIPLTIFAFSIFGAGLVIIGCAVFAYRNFADNIQPGYSFVITVIGGIILPIGSSTETTP